MMGSYYWGTNEVWFSIMSIIGPLTMLAIWGLIIFAIIALIRSGFGNSHSRGKEEKSAIDILKERYARGEIDKKEFEERKKDLS